MPIKRGASADGEGDGIIQPVSCFLIAFLGTGKVPEFLYCQEKKSKRTVNFWVNIPPKVLIV